jgi:hypothetical protein
MSYAERLLVLICCLLASIAWAALDDDMGVRVFNAADGKTLCEVKLKDYVESGDFSCKYYCLKLIKLIFNQDLNLIFNSFLAVTFPTLSSFLMACIQFSINLCHGSLQHLHDLEYHSGNFDGKDADVTHGGTDEIEMELFSYKNNVAFKQRVNKIHQIRHLDESLHLGHYKEFYIEDEKMGYVQKVLVTSGAAFVLNSALHQILDGFIWTWLGLPFFTVVMPRLTSFFKYFLSSINPINLFKKKRRFGFRRPHLFGKPKPQHPPHSKPQGPHKPDHTPQPSHGLAEEGQGVGVVSVVAESKSGVNRRRIFHTVKWGILSWLVVLVVSPLSISRIRGQSQKWTPGSIPTSTPRQQSQSQKQKYFSTSNTKTKNKNSEKKKSENRRGQRGAAAAGSSKGQGNIIQSLFFRWKHSSLSNRISRELFNGKKPPAGSPICPLRFVVVDAK